MGQSHSPMIVQTLQEERFHFNLNFAISLMAKSLNLNSGYDSIQKSKFAANI